MLHQMARQQSRINWPEVYMMAEATSEAFADVRIVTAKSEYDRLIEECVMDAAMSTPLTFCEGVCSPITVRESVTITTDGDISVVVNTPTVTDDDMWNALDLVADAMYQLDGKAGTVYFGDPLTFQSKQLPTLTLN